MRRLRRIGLALAAALGVAAPVFWLSLAPADPALFPARGEAISVAVLDHGYHTGIVIEQAALRAAALHVGQTDPELAARLRWLTERFPQAEWIELGWGDADFYRVTPRIGDIDPWLGLRALLWPTPSVLHVVPGAGPVVEAFPASDVVELRLSGAGFIRLAAALAATVPPEGPRPPLGPSLYGRGAFFPATLDYHLFRTCNHWISSLLRAAGVPSSALPSTFSFGLLAELKWRAV